MELESVVNMAGGGKIFLNEMHWDFPAADFAVGCRHGETKKIAGGLDDRGIG